MKNLTAAILLGLGTLLAPMLASADHRDARNHYAPGDFNGRYWPRHYNPNVHRHDRHCGHGYYGGYRPHGYYQNPRYVWINGGYHLVYPQQRDHGRGGWNNPHDWTWNHPD